MSDSRPDTVLILRVGRGAEPRRSRLGLKQISMATPIEATNLQQVQAEERLRRERDLYLGLLELNAEQDPEPFLRRALELIVGIVGARQGYLELFEADGAGWSHAAGDLQPDQLERVKHLVSRGIIAEAVASEQVVVTPSALLDSRFRDRTSVQESKIDAVLCAPVGEDPPCGVLYLQSGGEAGAFPSDHVEQVKRFARHLAPLVRQLVARRQTSASSEVRQVRERLKAFDFLGQSKALARVLREVEQVAALEVGVLLYGETGTGKTHVARLIHQNSRRASGPFVEVNCAALPDQLLESELFGAVPGAHSTANRRVEGKIAAAEHGTLLLDELGDLSLAAQAKLLQLLQAKEYYPLGSSRVLRADIRVIAATHVDLKQAMLERRFREDLYYRLQVIALRLPSLSERTDDVPALVDYFRERAQSAHRLPEQQFSPAALRALATAEWPGNIRQLSHVVEAAAIRAASQHARQIEVEHLFPEQTGSAEEGATLTYQFETRRFQALLVKKVLDSTAWNISAAARQLDLTRAHLYNLIKSFGLER